MASSPFPHPPAGITIHPGDYHTYHPQILSWNTQLQSRRDPLAHHSTHSPWHGILSNTWKLTAPIDFYADEIERLLDEASQKLPASWGEWGRLLRGDGMGKLKRGVPLKVWGVLWVKMLHGEYPRWSSAARRIEEGVWRKIEDEERSWEALKRAGIGEREEGHRLNPEGARVTWGQLSMARQGISLQDYETLQRAPEENYDAYQSNYNADHIPEHYDVDESPSNDDRPREEEGTATYLTDGLRPASYSTFSQDAESEYSEYGTCTTNLPPLAESSHTSTPAPFQPAEPGTGKARRRSRGGRRHKKRKAADIDAEHPHGPSESCDCSACVQYRISAAAVEFACDNRKDRRLAQKVQRRLREVMFPGSSQAATVGQGLGFQMEQAEQFQRSAQAGTPQPRDARMESAKYYYQRRRAAGWMRGAGKGGNVGERR